MPSSPPPPTYRDDPAQLALTLPPGRRIPGAPRLTWQRWSPEQQLAIEMDDTIGSYSTGRYVPVEGGAR